MREGGRDWRVSERRVRGRVKFQRVGEEVSEMMGPVIGVVSFGNGTRAIAHLLL